MKRVSFRAFSLVLTAILLGANSATVLAQSQTLQDAIQNCSSEANSLQRLVCYDRVAKSVREYKGGQLVLPSASVTPPAAQARVTPPAAPARQVVDAPAAPVNDAESQFGLEHRQDTDAMIQKLYAVITKISTDARRKRLITLDNGQRWRQQDSSTLKVSVGDTVYVERGVLGAFYLSTDDVNKRMKVKRDE
ncbi:hypothetical protein [Alteromonas flava]|uniref:hypothetical protein n=1 Tax=Alteromonas flava TaxID=2048003 RepID=UPI000C294604|nr:hypothetical protein [Alteromonas flava]